MEVGVFIAVLCLNIPFVVSQCTLPLADGDWISTSRGTWTVSGSGTQISNFQADLSGTVNTATMSCVAAGSTTDQYIFSTNQLFFQVFIDLYTCIEIVATERAPYSYIYYIVTATDTINGETFTSDQTAACSNTEFKTGANLNILTQSATVGNASINFPDLIFGNYSVVYTDKDGAEETDWTMDSCNNTQLLNFVHATSTNNVGFTTTTAPNLLQCLYYLTFGSDVYVFMYNNGTQDGSTSYSYTCWVFAYSGTNVVATAFPNTCQDNQTSTFVIYGGEKFTFTPYFTCPLNASSGGDEDSGLAGWIIALIVLGLLLLVAIIIVTIFYCYMRKSSKVDEEKGSVKEGDRHPSSDSLRELDVDEEKKKAHAEYRASTFRKNKGDENDKILEKDDLKGKGKEKERTLDLIEVSKDKSHKLQEVNPTNDKVKPGGIVTPREISKPQEVVKTKEEIRQEKLEEKRKEEERRQEEKRECKRQEENRKREEETQKKIKRAEEEAARTIKRAEEEDAKRIKGTEEEDARKTKRAEEEESKKKEEEALKKIIEPSGKTSIPPTTPKPELDEFEDGGDTAGKMMSREENERQKEERREGKKRLKKMARRKNRGHEHTPTSDSETEHRGRKKRRAGDPRGVVVPYIEQYHQKKDTLNTSCTLNSAAIYDIDEYNIHNSSLVGQLYSIAEQCELLNGDGAIFCSGNANTSTVCRDFGCKSEGKQKCNKYVATHGTCCSNHGSFYTYKCSGCNELSRWTTRDQNRYHILLLDEATANIDTTTDALIQETIRTCFHDCTVITIAHRLNTVLHSDRILVLDSGQVMECDTPQRLLSDQNSFINAMISAQAVKTPSP